MAERVVSVRLSAKVDEYKKGMAEAAQSTRSVGTEGAKLAQVREAMNQVGASGVGMGALIGAGVAVAVKKFADFDEAMSAVNAATHETSQNMALLRNAAIEAGASTVFSATEAAGAIEELSKAGVSTADILAGALAGSLDLAAAGELGVARAAEITSTALNQFGLSGDQASHVADVLAAGAGKAMGSVEDLANGLKFVGPVAASMGVSLEETAGVLALFAQQGIIGEQAGTSLRGVLASLTSPSAQARGEIERLGLTLYDSRGTFLGLENAAGQLSNAYSTMNGASRDASMGIIFGRESVTAATALYRAGADGVDEWTAAVDDSGYAADTARRRLDNLKGDLEALSGAMDTALIQTGSAANDSLRALVQTVTGLVDVYNDLPEPVQTGVLAVGGATAALGLFGGTALLTIPKIHETREAMRTLGLSAKGLSLTAGIAGAALGGLFLIVGELAREQAEARANAEAYSQTLEDGTLRVTRATRELAKENLSAKDGFWFIDNGSALSNAEKIGVSLDLVTEAAIGNLTAMRELDAQLKAGEDGSLEYANAAAIISEQVKGEAGSLEEAIEVARLKQKADKQSSDSSQTAADAYLQAASGADELTSSLDQLISKINEANGVGQDAISANLAYEDALANVDQQIRNAAAGVEGYALTLDTSTEAGRDNLGMLNTLAEQSQKAAEAQFALDGNTDAYKATLEAGRQALIDRAQQMGYNADEATRLADQIYRIPTQTEWKVIAETNEAQDRVNRLAGVIAGLQDKTVRINVQMPNGNPVSDEQLANQFGIRRASGGPVYGPGGPQDDRVPAMLSNGEHVLTANEVQAAGGHARVAQWRANLIATRQPIFTPDGPEVLMNTNPPSNPRTIIGAADKRELEMTR
ncbi:phage tail tape measure protein [Microbacterium sp. NPDC089189]|uniref:phage tail tape measure protein n=1 Tax=Microbacterium sp. NPDC089189 TaxID=3154972 RepID=UPI003449E3D0